MQELRDQGMTVREIGERFGLTYEQMHDFYWSGMYLNIDALDWNILLNMSVIDIRACNDELWVFVSYASLEDYAREYLV